MFINAYSSKHHTYQGNMGKFGDVIKQEREKQGWTQEELADKASITKASVSRYESGGQLPKNDTALRLADALFIDPRDALELLLEDALAQAPDAKSPGTSSNEIIRTFDPDEVRVIKYLRGVPPELRQSAINAVESYKTAGDLLRERQEANTVGKRADRHENQSVREKRGGNDAISSDE